MNAKSIFTLVPLVTFAAAAASRPQVTTVAEIRGATQDVDFTVTGTVTHVFGQPDCSFVLNDATARERFCLPDKTIAVRTGDMLRIDGSSFARRCLWDAIVVARHDVLGHSGETVSPIPLTARADCESRLLQTVTVRGRVDDVFLDETDSDWFHLQLKLDDDTLLVSVPANDAVYPRTFLGATVSATGICVYNLNGVRRFTGWRVLLKGCADLVVLSSATTDPTDAPPLPSCDRMGPDRVLQLVRRSVTGEVVAVWRRNRILLRDLSGKNLLPIKIELADGETTPPIGTGICAAGIVCTDLFRICLSRARIKVLADEPTRTTKPEEPPLDGTSLCRTVNGRIVFRGQFFWRRIALEGTVLQLPSENAQSSELALLCEDHIIPVDISTCPETRTGLSSGCRIRATGFCIPEAENWSPSQPYPIVNGVVVAIARAEDITLLARPSWWTPGRLFVALIALLAGLVGIFVWNVLLRRAIRRRERELKDEIVARVGSEFKIQERTRLAVELHDAISQNLTGIALQLRTALRLAIGVPDALHNCLVLATATLAACRDELRNCLWDLRNNTLEETDMNEAIHQTLAPHLADATATIRFNVPRERLTDNTAHAILRIVRELAVNAIRHGHATELKIAGALEPDILRFSVRDNGCGFDPATAPGPDDGHFGLQGIRERIESTGGELKIDTAVGCGTQAVVLISLSK